MNATPYHFKFGTEPLTETGTLFFGAVVSGTNLAYDDDGATSGWVDRIDVQSEDASGAVTVLGSFDGLSANASSLNAAFEGVAQKWYDPSLYFDLGSIFSSASDAPTAPDDAPQDTQQDALLTE